jgi:23S rRNA pseudouridine1911/1915/1917 synthase
MKSRIVLVVPDDAPTDRLDHFLGEQTPSLSRTRAKEIILAGLVTLNGEQAKPSARIAPGDVIEADVPEFEALRADPEDIPLDVLYEDDDIVVVNKPAGMVVHPAPGAASGTLVNALLGRGAALSEAGGALRPGIVHRLDRDTSGVIVVAKNDAAHRALAEAFQERRVSKRYLAILWGSLGGTEGTIDEPVGRRRSDRKRMWVTTDGRDAVTGWKAREEYPVASLVELSPRTGRTHQIRVHVAHLHHPVVGDADYGGVRKSFADVPPHFRRDAKRLNAAALRQALHARGLAFEHPASGESMRFAAPLPDDFAGLLSLLRFPDGESRRAVGVDPGEARVGLALSDEGRLLASPLPTLEMEGDRAVAAAVAEVVREHDADTVVVGYPIRMDGSVGPRAVRARELAVAIEDAARARVVLRDERLSSAEAERVMRERGERSRGRKGRVDQIAASVILQGYLDEAGARPKGP